MILFDIDMATSRECNNITQIDCNCLFATKPCHYRASVCVRVGRAGLILKNSVFSEFLRNDVFQSTQLSPSIDCYFSIILG